VDHADQTDPGTAITRTFSASTFASGNVTAAVDTSSDHFYRVCSIRPGSSSA
jgi:hypothetical protein